MKNRKYPYYHVPYVSNMKDLLSFCADHYGSKTAFWHGKRDKEIRHSYIDVQNDTAAFSTFLYDSGYAGKHIALLGENSYEWIISYFAIVNMGGVVVPIDKESDTESITGLLKKADVELLIHSKAYSKEAEATGFKTLSLKNINTYFSKGAEIINNSSTAYADYPVEDESVCAIVFTSGTTGNPKGVMLSHRSLMMDAINSARNLYAPEGAVSILPLYHTFGWMACVLDQMILGHGVYIIGSLKRIIEDINYSAPRHICAVPMLVEAIYNGIWSKAAEQGKEKQLKSMIKISNMLRKIGIDKRRVFFRSIYKSFGGKLEMIISGGSGIEEKYIRGLDDIGIKLTNGYGITELSPIVATMRNKHFAVGSVGCVNPGIDCRIKDGEIQLKGETLFSGYYKDEKATVDAFDGEWFITGDLGYFDNDGLLYITGRKKNLIILSNGKNVSPEELETLLSSVENVQEVIVYADSDRLIAEIYPKNGDVLFESGIRQAILNLNRTLPKYKQISDIRFRNTEFEKTATKKIKRH